MKVFTSIFLLSLIVASCSPETALQESETTDASTFAKKTFDEAANAANDKDYAGPIYYRLLDEYYGLPASPRTLQQTILLGESFAYLDPGFLALPDTASYGPLSADDLEPYIITQEQDIQNLLSEEFGSNAKGIFSEMTAELANLKDDDATYSTVHQYLVGLEQKIIESTIPETQASAILVTTSLLRYGMLHDKKRKRRDRDWDWMTTSIAATANAALESESLALITSFAMDVYEN